MLPAFHLYPLSQTIIGTLGPCAPFMGGGGCVPAISQCHFLSTNLLICPLTNMLDRHTFSYSSHKGPHFGLKAQHLCFF